MAGKTTTKTEEAFQPIKRPKRKHPLTIIDGIDDASGLATATTDTVPQQQPVDSDGKTSDSEDHNETSPIFSVTTQEEPTKRHLSSGGTHIGLRRKKN